MESLKSKSIIDTYIKIIILTLLIVWSFLIAKPFILIIIWSVIVAVSIFPFYQKIINLFHGKKKGLLTGFFILIILSIIVLPSLKITTSIVASSENIIANFKDGSIKVPEPRESVKDWPIIGENIYDSWKQASSNMESFLKNNKESVANGFGWIFTSLTGLLGAVFLSLISILIAGVFMFSADSGYKGSVKFANRIMKGKGESLINMCTSTIRSVVKGILLVAIIQTILAFILFSIAGLPAAGVFAFIVLIAAIIQIPVLLPMIPAIIYAFSALETTPAILFTVFALLIALSDNFLKPMLLGKGLETPMIIILIGALGGMMFQGILGLFVGPVILAIVYQLYTNWIEEEV